MYPPSSEVRGHRCTHPWAHPPPSYIPSTTIIIAVHRAVQRHRDGMPYIPAVSTGGWVHT